MSNNATSKTDLPIMDSYPPSQDPSLVPFRSVILGVACKFVAVLIWIAYPVFFICVGYNAIPVPESLKAFSLWLDSVRESSELLWLILAFIVGLPLILPLQFSGFLWTRGRQLMATLAADVLRTDLRHPILYLRPFDLDNASKPANSPEDGLVKILHRLGPVVSIGIPGEKYQTPGTARLYVRDSEWKPAVLNLMQFSAAVVLVMGESKGIEWELRTMLNHHDLRRLLIVFLLPGRDALGTLAVRLREFFRSVPEQLEGHFGEDCSNVHGGRAGLGIVGVAVIDPGPELRFLSMTIKHDVITGDNNCPVGEINSIDWEQVLGDFFVRIATAERPRAIVKKTS